MNTQERQLARIMFRDLLRRSNGQVFEDIFTQTMSYYCSDFQAIKPWGNIGDRKNDGYDKTSGTFYQVYAPEDGKNYKNAVNKIKKDFSKLIEQWNPVHSFYFVINDKFLGVNADCEQTIQEIKMQYSLNNAGIMTAKDLERYLFSLDDDQILVVTGNIPDPANIKTLDFSIVKEVIAFIMSLPIQPNSVYDTNLPDFEEKIRFNGLSEITSQLLKSGLMKAFYLEEYLAAQGDFTADLLRDHINEVYEVEKKYNHGDDLFMSMVNNLSPKQQLCIQETVIIIMAKYFETCDIFEAPNKE